MAETLTRPSRFAGSFYPGSANEIKKSLDLLKERAGEPPGSKRPSILIIPHAGWVYSGLAAVKGILSLTAAPPSRVILIGPAHRHYFLGFSIGAYDSYSTPLGDIPVDDALQKTIADQTGFEFFPEAHEPEHSLEVIVPMLQHFLPDGLKILPILAGSVSKASIAQLADSLASNLNPSTDVVIVSSDLSHFYPYDEAREFDQKTLNFVLDGDSESIIEQSGDGGRLACGFGGMVVAIQLAKRWELASPELLIYYNSGDTGADKDSVVGYASIAWPPPDLSVA